MMFRLLPTLMILENLFFVKPYINNALVRNTILKYSDPEAKHQHDLSDGDFPFVVSLVFIEQEIVTRHCTGSLLSPVWVLSASNCFYDLLDRKFFVWYSNFTVSPLKSKMYARVKKIYIHPLFQSTEFTRPGYFFGDNDISLLRVRKLDTRYFGRLSPIDPAKMTGLPVTYIGAGAKVKPGDRRITPLQVAEGVVITCGLSLTMWSQYMQCVAPKCSDKSHQPVHSDSGGPFIYDGKIVGVMSMGYQIPKSFILSNGLTPISPYKSWITHIRQTRSNIIS